MLDIADMSISNRVPKTRKYGPAEKDRVSYQEKG